MSHLLYNKRNPALPPLLAGGKFASEFCEKANLFSKFFSSVCTPTQNTKILPIYLYRTDARTASFPVTRDDILVIKKNFKLI